MSRIARAATAGVLTLSTGCLLFNSLDGYEGTLVTPDAPDASTPETSAPPPDIPEASVNAVDFAWATSADGMATPFAIYPFDGGAAHAVGCPISMLTKDGGAVDVPASTRAPAIMASGHARFTGDDQARLAFEDHGVHVVSATSRCGDPALPLEKDLDPDRVAVTFPRLKRDGSRVLYVAIENIYNPKGLADVRTSGDPDGHFTPKGTIADSIENLSPPEWHGAERVGVEVSKTQLSVTFDGKAALSCGTGGELWGGMRRIYQVTPLADDKTLYLVVIEGAAPGRRIRVFDLPGATSTPRDQCLNTGKSTSFVISSSESYAGDVGVSPDASRIGWVAQADPAATQPAEGSSHIRIAAPAQGAIAVDCPNDAAADDVGPRWLTPDVLTWTRVPRADPTRAQIMLTDLRAGGCGAPRALDVPSGYVGLLGFSNESRGQAPPQ